MDKILEGKVGLITGAGSGFGREIAITFAREGANLVLNDIDLESLEETRDIILKQHDCEILLYQMDISDADKVKEKVLLRLGRELGGRCNVVMTRLNDDDLKRIDGLVEVELFKSRSEAVAFFIKEGIQARKDLFESVMSTVEKIKELKEQAKKNLKTE